MDITRCFSIKDETLYVLGEHCLRLERLLMLGVPHVTDKGIKALAEGCRRLETLDLSADLNMLETSTKSRVPHYTTAGLQVGAVEFSVQ